MSMLDLIRSRRSVRTFDGKPLPEETAMAILEYAQNADNPYNIPITWKLLDAAEYGLNSPVITGTDIFIAGKSPRAPHAEEAFGYTFEKVVLFAQSLGVGTTWIGGTMNRDAFEKAIGLTAGEMMPCVSPLGYPARKMSIRETMMRKAIKADSRFSFEEIFCNGSFDKPLKKEDAGKLTDALEAVRLAPSAVNKQPWRALVKDGAVHFYEKPSPGYVDKDGFDMQKVDLGIALCHFESVARESGIDVRFEISDPGLDTPEGLTYIGTFL